ncbi:MAG: hypothetical protein R3C49_22105 [Planctomycetaceae bacterium]
MPFDPNDPQQVCINIRRRPAMYVGGRDVHGMTQLVWELVANSVDRFLAGHATGVRVVTSGNHVEVSDDGFGLPFDLDAVDGRNLGGVACFKVRVPCPRLRGYVLSDDCVTLGGDHRAQKI